MTYRFESDENDWMFRRDEIDLLEEELEEIYHAIEAHNPSETEMEQSVLKEQVATEELVEMELTVNWGSEMLEHEHNSHEKTFELNTNISVQEMLREQVRRDPLYSLAYIWAQDVFRFVKEQYLSGNDQTRDMFRVYLNVIMIPIKLSIGRMDESEEDPFLLQVIQKEYDLGLIYLERTLESLRALVVLGYDLLIPFVTTGEVLRSKLVDAIKRFGRSDGPSDHV